MVRARSEKGENSASVAVPAFKPSIILRLGSESSAPLTAGTASRHLPAGISTPAVRGSLPHDRPDVGWQDQYSAVHRAAKQSETM
ncbi:hypothetical protein [Rhizorhapis sp. SPR117]|uniref:hypothetical protein n=1 Tax=Rhizorhapis sp. SPR117 TaxID=2912611 RepID=UPI001F3CC1AB